MKIKSKIALRYTAVTAVLLFCFAILVYVFSAKDREKVFYQDLKKEGISKANLFFNSEASPEILHSIYRNNIEYINEVEVAIYNKDYELIYHDDAELDIVKETRSLFLEIQDKQRLAFRIDKYQAVGFTYEEGDEIYIITAAAYDGYGYEKLQGLIKVLVILFVLAVIFLFFIGYFLAERALKPVASITKEFEGVMSSNLFPHIVPENEHDEIGLLIKQINRALSVIKESYDSQKMFISNVSHELRTPLATLIGEIDIALLKERTEEEYCRVLSHAKEDSLQLIRLINGLLDLARASYDSNKIGMTPIRVDEVLLDVRELVLKQNEGYKVHLDFEEEASDRELNIRGNEYLLMTAFANLIENNCKYSDDHTSMVTLGVSDDFVKIEFLDNGVGMDEEDLKNIFIPFFRGKNKDLSEGHGIGMVLVEKVIALHMGEINIDTKKGIGTKFIVRIPLIS